MSWARKIHNDQKKALEVAPPAGMSSNQKGRSPKAMGEKGYKLIRESAQIRVRGKVEMQYLKHMTPKMIMHRAHGFVDSSRHIGRYRKVWGGWTLKCNINQNVVEGQGCLARTSLGW